MLLDRHKKLMSGVLPQTDAPARMIIALARIESLLLLTCDERILSYGNQKVVATMHAWM